MADFLAAFKQVVGLWTRNAWWEGLSYMGRHWKELPNDSSDQTAKDCQKRSENCVLRRPGLLCNTLRTLLLDILARQGLFFWALQ